RQRLEGVLVDGVDGDLVESRVPARHIERRLGTVHAGDALRAACRGRHAPGARVAEHVQHPGALHVPHEPRTIVALVVEPAGLLAPLEIDLEIEAVLADAQRPRRLADDFLRADGPAFQPAHRQVALADDAARLYVRLQR